MDDHDRRPKDPRRFKTKRDIKEGFISLLSDGAAFRKVTVNDICAKALVSRSTFYDHYTDKYNLLACVVEEIVAVFDELLAERFTPGATFQDVLADFIQEFCEAHGREASVLLAVHEPEGDLEAALRSSLRRAFRERFYTAASTDEQADLVAALYSSCALEVMRRALSTGLSQEDVALIDRLQEELIKQLR